MARIQHLQAREILDSRGMPTVEVDLVLDDGSFGRAAVPSGASTGTHEAHELRDGEACYMGKGVLKAVENVETEIQKRVAGSEWEQESLDRALIELDGTSNKEHLGANAILGVSLAFAHAEAASKKILLYQYIAALAGTESKMHMPTPMMNILNGGKHAEGAADLQEFMVVPRSGATFAENLRMGTETFHALKKILKEKKLHTAVGDEGGFAPALGKNEAALELIVDAIQKAGYQPGQAIAIAIDAAASEFFHDGAYTLASEGRTLSQGEMITLYADWAKRYPIISIEDGLAEDDWEGFSALTAELGANVQIVGDDLFVTNPERLKKGIELKAANSILVKLNQIGTLTETIEAVQIATDAGFASVISHRSGETEDTTIADLAVGLGTGQIKTGAPSRGERTAKYNRLLRIEEELSKK